MNQEIVLTLAEHTFTLSIPEGKIPETALAQYRPFEGGDPQKALFAVEVVEELTCEVVCPLIEDANPEEDMTLRVDVYRTTTGTLFKIILPNLSQEVDAMLHLSGQRATVWVNQDSVNWVHGFHNTLMLSYICYTLPYDTLLLHSSAILLDNRVYLFIAKSGTGKSTHSQMWMESFPESELLNDDHPIIRLHPSGEVIAYGSPWSGKTPCYRNLSAPAAAIVRIKRAPHNQLHPILSAARRYASVMTCNSAVQWDSTLATAKAEALGRIVRTLPCYEMECLPNPEAAEVCYKGTKR